MQIDQLLTLVSVISPMSLVAVGGVTAMVGDLQHQAVDLHRWLTPREFVDLFTIARIAPGPGAMLVTLVGWKAAGWAGAIVATAALLLPPSLLCLAIARLYQRYRDRAWMGAIETGLAPIGAGRIFASALAVLRLAGPDVFTWATCALAAGLLTLRPKLHPLMVLFSSGGVFALAHTLFV
jgi:chromate transporter